MIERVVLPYSGELLVSHLAAYGLVVALEVHGTRASLSHSRASLTYEPQIEFVGGVKVASAAIRATATALESIVEADIEEGKTGNARRSVIWARASFAADPSHAEPVLRRRQELLTRAESRGNRLAQGLLAGLGAPAVWGGERVKPSCGATALDGVLGNNTSDLVRGVLRPARKVCAEIGEEDLETAWDRRGPDPPPDKTGWAPPGTRVDMIHQWLAALGLAMLPVAHQSFKASRTPATSGDGRRITLPILRAPVTSARAKALLALEALCRLNGSEPDDPDVQTAVAEIRMFGVSEAVSFHRLSRPGAGSSKAFTFKLGTRLDLRCPALT